MPDVVMDTVVPKLGRERKGYEFKGSLSYAAMSEPSCAETLSLRNRHIENIKWTGSHII